MSKIATIRTAVKKVHPAASLDRFDSEGPKGGTRKGMYAVMEDYEESDAVLGAGWTQQDAWEDALHRMNAGLGYVQ